MGWKKDTIINQHVKHGWNKNFDSLNRLDTDSIARVLYEPDSYKIKPTESELLLEIEEEFKWCIDKEIPYTNHSHIDYLIKQAKRVPKLLTVIDIEQKHNKINEREIERFHDAFKEIMLREYKRSKNYDSDIFMIARKEIGLSKREAVKFLNN